MVMWEGEEIDDIDRRKSWHLSGHINLDELLLDVPLHS